MDVALRVQQFIISKKTLITRIFQFGEVALVFGVFVLSLFAKRDPTILISAAAVGRLFGKLSSVFLVITLVPGILGRLRVFPIVRVILMTFRRHLGITTYLLAVSHSMLLYWLPSFLYGFSPLQIFQLFGIFAILFGTPLFFTSNDYSVRVLKAWWKRIHKLVYLMLLFASLHVMYISKFGTTSLLLTGTLVLELVSFLVQYMHGRSTPR